MKITELNWRKKLKNQQANQKVNIIKNTNKQINKDQFGTLQRQIDGRRRELIHLRLHPSVAHYKFTTINWQCWDTASKRARVTQFAILFRDNWWYFDRFAWTAKNYRGLRWESRWLVEESCWRASADFPAEWMPGRRLFPPSKSSYRWARPSSKWWKLDG